jgi:hypothetical protein
MNGLFRGVRKDTGEVVEGWLNMCGGRAWINYGSTKPSAKLGVDWIECDPCP